MDNSITNRNRLQTQMIDIQDKRNYAINYPTTNIVINQALAVSSNALSNDELAQTIRNLCANNNDALINVALNLAPSYSVSEIIWQTLHRAINSNNDHTLTGACLFAIPIILVAGSKNPQILNSSLDNQLIADFFAQQQIINLPTSNWFISGKLVDAKTIATFSPSQYYFWARNIDNAKLWLPVDIPANPIRVHNEGVFVRFLLGVATNCGAFTDIKQLINFDRYQEHSKELMNLILQQLKLEQVTLFPIPFAPCYLSIAHNTADNYRKEIALAVSMSNLTRKIKQAGLTPTVKFRFKDEQIEVILSTREPSSYVECNYWQLTPYDNLAYVQSKMRQLVDDLALSYEVDNN